MAHSLKEGDIFVYSWGYDQTNVNFFQVIKTGEKTVAVREIETESVPGTEGFMCDWCIPKPGVFRPGSKPARKLVRTVAEDRPEYCLKFDSDYGYLWDGKPQQRSWYA